MKRLFFTIAAILFSIAAFSQIPSMSSLRVKGNLYLDKITPNDTVKLVVINTLGKLDTISVSSFAVESADTSNIKYLNGLTKTGDTIKLGGLLVDSTTLSGNHPLIISDGTVIIGKQNRSNPVLLNLIADNDTIGGELGGYIKFTNQNQGNSIPVGTSTTAPSVNTKILFADASSTGAFKTAIGTRGTAGAAGRTMFLSATNDIGFYVSNNEPTSYVMNMSGTGININKRIRLQSNTVSTRTSSALNPLRDSSALSIFDAEVAGFIPTIVFSQQDVSNTNSSAGTSNYYSGLPTPEKAAVIDTFRKVSGLYTGGTFTKNSNYPSLGNKLVFKDLMNYSYQTGTGQVLAPGDTITQLVSGQMTNLAFGLDASYTTTPINNYTNFWLSLPRNNHKDRFAIYGGSQIERFRFAANGNLTINQSGTTITNTDSLPLSINSTKAIQLPKGTTAQRPTGAQQGWYRYNTDSSNVEYFNGSIWVTPGGATIGGGNIYTGDGVIDGNRLVDLDTFSIKFVSDNRLGLHINSKVSNVYPVLSELFGDGILSGATNLSGDSVFAFNGLINISDPEEPVVSDVFSPIDVLMKGNIFPFEDLTKKGVVIINTSGIDTVNNIFDKSTQVFEKDLDNGVFRANGIGVSNEEVSINSSDFTTNINSNIVVNSNEIFMYTVNGDSTAQSKGLYINKDTLKLVNIQLTSLFDNILTIDNSGEVKKATLSGSYEIFDDSTDINFGNANTYYIKPHNETDTIDTYSWVVAPDINTNQEITLYFCVGTFFKGDVIVRNFSIAGLENELSNIGMDERVTAGSSITFVKTVCGNLQLHSYYKYPENP